MSLESSILADLPSSYSNESTVLTSIIALTQQTLTPDVKLIYLDRNIHKNRTFGYVFRSNLEMLSRFIRKISENTVTFIFIRAVNYKSSTEKSYKISIIWIFLAEKFDIQRPITKSLLYILWVSY